MNEDSQLLPQDVLGMTPIEAQDSFTDDERSIFEPFSEYIDSKEDGDFDWYYGLGCRMVEIWKLAIGGDEDSRRRRGDADNGGRTYFREAGSLGPKFLERLARSKGYRSTSTLMQAMQVVETWPEKSAYDEVVSRRGEAGHRLSWTHLAYVTAIADDEERDQLIHECLREGWSTQELFQRLKGHRSEGNGGAGGRPPKVPKGLQEAFTHINTWCKKSCRLIDQSWMDEERDQGFHIRQEFDVMDVDEFDDNLLSSLCTAESQLSSLSDKLLELLRVTTDLRCKIQDSLEAEAEVEEDEEFTETQAA